MTRSLHAFWVYQATSSFQSPSLQESAVHKELSFCEKQEFHLIENVSSSRPSLRRKPNQEASPYGRPRMYSFFKEGALGSEKSRHHGKGSGLKEEREPKRTPSRKVADISDTRERRGCATSFVSSWFLVSSSSSHCRQAMICERHRPTQKLMLSQKTFSKVGSHEGDRDQARQRQGWGSEIMKTTDTEVLLALGTVVPGL